MKSVPNTLRIRTALENAIVDGRYLPGSQLDPEALARQFDCSRTPIREALQQLEASGLVRILPKRGTYVSQWSVEELAERFEVMAELEATCGRLAAQRISSEELSRLIAAHEDCQRCVTAGDTDAYYLSNSVFHHCIYRGTHNAFLEQEASRMHAMLQPYRRMQVKARNRMAKSFDEHADIVQAITAGDEDLAASLLRNHVIIQGGRFHELIALLRQTGPEA